MQEPSIVHDQIATADGDLAHQRAPDIIEALNAQTPEAAAKVLQQLSFDMAVEVLDQPGIDNVCEIIAALPTETAIALLSAVSADRAADTFKELIEPLRTTLLNGLNQETRTTVSELLAYPERSAGSIMTTEFVSVPANWTIAEVLHHIRMVERTRETVYSIFVVDPVKKTLIQAVPLRRLISGDPHANVLTAARRPQAADGRAACRPHGGGAPDIEIRSACGSRSSTGRATCWASSPLTTSSTLLSRNRPKTLRSSVAWKRWTSPICGSVFSR